MSECIQIGNYILEQRQTCPPAAAWQTTYSDVGPCIELIATFDDSIKKNDSFTHYAIMVAQQIVGKRAKVTWGKWGARLEMAENSRINPKQLAALAKEIIRHPSWYGLTLSTWVFTYGSKE